MRIPFVKEISWYLIFAMFIIGIAPNVEAGFAPSELIVSPNDGITGVDRTTDMEKIQKGLESKAIKERLEKLGFTQDEINNRLAQLSDQQIHQLALQLDELKVGGGDASEVVKFIFGLVLAILLVWGIVWALGSCYEDDECIILPSYY